MSMLDMVDVFRQLANLSLDLVSTKILDDSYECGQMMGHELNESLKITGRKFELDCTRMYGKKH